ncbi:MAG: hypothetical protein KDD45_14025, partial [Bdellovibrionales bacterium]|nr:hypothetical protein [Bdellovibrionales bacterium]
YRKIFSQVIFARNKLIANTPISALLDICQMKILLIVIEIFMSSIVRGRSFQPQVQGQVVPVGSVQTVV